MKLFDLTGKMALVTGSTDGLGKAIALGLAEANAFVIINGRSSKDKVDNVVMEFRKKGLKAAGYLCDVTDRQAVGKMVTSLEKEFGAIDILVNNAGINVRAPLEHMTIDQFMSNINVNLLGPFIVSRAVVKGMIARRSGKIINICSMMSELGRDTVGAYAASKGGLKMLTKNMATEWARYNIQVNGIGPGYFATKLTAPLRTKGNQFNDFIISRTPACRWGQPEELAGAAVFLASKASDFINGHILYVDGGLSATIGRPAYENGEKF